MSGGEGTATALCGCDVDVSRLIAEVPPGTQCCSDSDSCHSACHLLFFLFCFCHVSSSMTIILFFKFLYLIIYSIICDAGPFSIAETWSDLHSPRLLRLERQLQKWVELHLPPCRAAVCILSITSAWLQGATQLH